MYYLKSLKHHKVCINVPHFHVPQKKKNNTENLMFSLYHRSNRTADQHLPATKQKTKEALNAKQKKHPFAETVTLTKAQLDAILASVGKLPVTDKNLFSINETSKWSIYYVYASIYFKYLFSFLFC